MITFSSDSGRLSREDLDKTSEMAEEYFGMESDPDQIPATRENRDWIYENLSDYVNIIRNEDEIIGFSFIIPCNKKLMDRFVNKKINEAELFEEVKKINLNKLETLYWCSAFVNKEFRGKGLALSAIIKIINKVTNDLKNKPTLFYWKYSNEGEVLGKRIADLTGLRLLARK